MKRQRYTRRKHHMIALLSSVMLVTPVYEHFQDTPIEVAEQVNELMEELEGTKDRRGEEERRLDRFLRKEEKESKMKQREYHSHFDVYFVNYNGEILYHQMVPVGEDAHYEGPVPEREPDDLNTYRFEGWDKPLTNIQCDTVFTAQYHKMRRHVR